MLRTTDIFLALSLVLPVTTVEAAPKIADAPADQVKTILDCQGQAQPAERLACYDKAAAKLAASVKRKDIVVVDKAEVQATRRSLFGFSLPRLPMLENAAPGPEERQIADTVASARQDGDGNWIVTLKSGAVWAQTDGQVVARAPRAGDNVVVNRGTLGAYFMRIAKQPGVKARRLN